MTMGIAPINVLHYYYYLLCYLYLTEMVKGNVKTGRVDPGTCCVGEELGKFEYLQRSAMSSKGRTTVTSQRGMEGYNQKDHCSRE